jgi:DNA-binding transcriptional MerR regulator
MWPTEFAEDFSGLTAKQIRELEKLRILTPKRDGRAKYYQYSDILILRIIRILKREGIRYNKSRDAYSFLRNLKTSQPLTSYVILHDKQEIYTVVDGNLLIASKGGQHQIPEVIEPILLAVGTELESTRKAVQRIEHEMRTAQHQIQNGEIYTYSNEELSRLLAG